METTQPEREPHPASLEPGARVGPWQVLERRGQGFNGTVYRAVMEGNEKAGAFALKVAHHSMDERFERESELLFLIHHGNVPRFHSRGYYECALGVFPYVVMELVEGVALYDWARQRNPTQRQVVEVLAQVARALHAVHCVGGVHRDVKGDNVLVRLADGRPYVADLGVGMLEGWKRVTGDVWPPNTPAYRSPEQWSFGRMYQFFPHVHYEAGPADDLFALGMMAYRLVTDEYPAPTHPDMPGSEVWRQGGKGPRPPRELNPRVSSQLDAIILRLLAIRRTQRFEGSAAVAAQALEELLCSMVPGLDEPLFVWAPKPAEAPPAAQKVEGEKWEARPRQRAPEMVNRFQERDAAARTEWERQKAEERRQEEKERARLLARAVLFGAVALGVMMLLILVPQQESPQQQEASSVAQAQTNKQLEGADAGTSGLSDGISSVSVTKEPPPYQSPGFFIEVPKTPLAGQRRAPCRPGSEEVEIRGGCWRYALEVKPPCGDGYFEWEKSCYTPVLRFQREPTSDEP